MKRLFENINTARLAEGLGLGAALGLDLTMLREVFSQTGANSRALETDGEDMQNREHSCFFSAAHAAKDSGIALELARSLGLDLPLARATKEHASESAFAAIFCALANSLFELAFVISSGMHSLSVLFCGGCTLSGQLFLFFAFIFVE